MHFMSIEVAAQKFLFRPRVSGHGANVTDIVQRARGVLQNITAPLPFSHNHLHDLESLWWVAIWIVFYNHFSKAQRSDNESPFNLTDAEHHLKRERRIDWEIGTCTWYMNWYMHLWQCRNLSARTAFLSELMLRRPTARLPVHKIDRITAPLANAAPAMYIANFQHGTCMVSVTR